MQSLEALHTPFCQSTVVVFVPLANISMHLEDAPRLVEFRLHLNSGAALKFLASADFNVMKLLTSPKTSFAVGSSMR